MTDPVTVEQIKACPFCGGEAMIRHVPAHDHTPILKSLIPNLPAADDTYWPECPACGCAKEGRATEEEAVAAWNTRVSPSREPGESDLRGKLQHAQSTVRAFEKVLGVEVNDKCPICAGVEGCSHTLGERIRAAIAALTLPSREPGEDEVERAFARMLLSARGIEEDVRLQDLTNDEWKRFARAALSGMSIGREQDVPRTSAAKWREEGKPDPHGDSYDCERAGGNLTDDEVAFQTAMLMRGDLNHEAVLQTAKDRIRWLSRKLEAALTRYPDSVMREAYPGRTAELLRRRVVTLAKLGLMLSKMSGGAAAEVEGYDAATLYADVLMALAIEDADDGDIALEIARDHPEGDTLIAALTLPEQPRPVDDVERMREALDRISSQALCHGMRADEAELRDWLRNIAEIAEGALGHKDRGGE